MCHGAISCASVLSLIGRCILSCVQAVACFAVVHERFDVFHGLGYFMRQYIGSFRCDQYIVFDADADATIALGIFSAASI
jgi:hypothetical protein